MKTAFHARLVRLVLLLSLCFSPGCATLFAPDMEMLTALDRNRPDEAISLFDAHYRSLEAADLASLFYYCDAQLRLNRFRQADACLNALQARATALSDYQQASLDSLRAHYLLALGQFQAAAHLAERAQKHLPALWNLQPYTTAGIARATLGHTQQARHHLDTLKAALAEEKPLLFDHGPFAEQNQQARLAIHVALNDYAGAGAILDEISREDPLATRLVKGLGYGVMGAAALYGDLSAAGSLLEGAISELDIQAAAAARAAFLQGQVAYARGDLKAAATAYDAVLNEPLSRNMNDLYYTSLQKRARIALQQGDSQRAEGWLKTAIEVVESQRASIHTESFKIGFVGDKQAAYQDMIALQLQRQAFATALHYVERAKARAMVDMLAARRPAVAGTATTAAAGLAHPLLDDIDQLEQQSAQGPIALSRQRGDSQRALVRKKQQQLATEAPHIASLASVDIAPIDTLQARLGPHEALVEYYAYQEQLYVFVLTRDQVFARPLDGKGLAPAVEAFRRALQEPQTQTYLGLGAQLYQRLIAPVATRIAGYDLTIVPHGVLHYVPFAALGEDNHFLVDQHALNVLPTASTLHYLQARPDRQHSLLALGNPQLEHPSQDLPGAEAEVRAITRQIPASRTYLREDATETRLKAEGRNFSHLHIASHGVFDPARPLDSALLLAKSDRDDGRMTVRELYSLPLQADLVVLSACETALNDLQSGDELMGFSRGFLYAGANAIVASLWKVDDQATADLMTGFYQALPGGYRQALRQAQQHTRQRYPHPYYWAAFVLTGNP